MGRPPRNSNRWRDRSHGATIRIMGVEEIVDDQMLEQLRDADRGRSCRPDPRAPSRRDHAGWLQWRHADRDDEAGRRDRPMVNHPRRWRCRRTRAEAGRGSAGRARTDRAVCRTMRLVGTRRRRVRRLLGWTVVRKPVRYRSGSAAASRRAQSDGTRRSRRRGRGAVTRGRPIGGRRGRLCRATRPSERGEVDVRLGAAAIANRDSDGLNDAHPAIDVGRHHPSWRTRECCVHHAQGNVTGGSDASTDRARAAAPCRSWRDSPFGPGPNRTSGGRRCPARGGVRWSIDPARCSDDIAIRIPTPIRELPHAL